MDAPKPPSGKGYTVPLAVQKSPNETISVSAICAKMKKGRATETREQESLPSVQSRSTEMMTPDEVVSLQGGARTQVLESLADIEEDASQDSPSNTEMISAVSAKVTLILDAEEERSSKETVILETGDEALLLSEKETALLDASLVDRSNLGGSGPVSLKEEEKLRKTEVMNLPDKKAPLTEIIHAPEKKGPATEVMDMPSDAEHAPSEPDDVKKTELMTLSQGLHVQPKEKKTELMDVSSGQESPVKLDNRGINVSARYVKDLDAANKTIVLAPDKKALEISSLPTQALSATEGSGEGRHTAVLSSTRMSGQEWEAQSRSTGKLWFLVAVIFFLVLVALGILLLLLADTHLEKAAFLLEDGPLMLCQIRA